MTLVLCFCRALILCSHLLRMNLVRLRRRHLSGENIAWCELEIERITSVLEYLLVILPQDFVSVEDVIQASLFCSEHCHSSSYHNHVNPGKIYLYLQMIKNIKIITGKH